MNTPDTYTKPINKSSLTVRFFASDFSQSMELPRVPLQGEFFRDINTALLKITKVIYVPWNQNLEDIQIEGEKV